jgi:L-lactate dehydrogenase complex protein LldG
MELPPLRCRRAVKVSSQDAFLARVRRALRKDLLPESARLPWRFGDPQLQAEAASVRERLRAQRTALVAQLQQQLTAVDGVVICVSSVAEAMVHIGRLAREKQATSVVRWQSEVLQALEVDAGLRQHGITVHVAAPPADTVAGEPASDTAVAEARQVMRQVVSQADIGLSGVDVAIAQTGTLVLSALPGQMRGVSLLPPVHVAVVRAEQIVATMADYLLLLRAAGDDVQYHLTSCISFITGPSRTGDIELSLTAGVHGPGEVHLVILNEPPEHAVAIQPAR